MTAFDPEGLCSHRSEREEVDALVKRFDLIPGWDRTRPSWDDYFLAIATVVSSRADCRRKQHGCVIVKDHRIVATGYNGSPAGDERSCLAGDCDRGLMTDEEVGEKFLTDYSNCISLHCEQNAIAYADPDRTRGATLYVTGPQCDMCEKLIRAAGIVRVVWPGNERTF